MQRAEEERGREKGTLTLNFGSVYHVMNSTCIHYEVSRPKYIHVQVLGNMHKTPYTTGKLQKIHIYLTTLSRVIVQLIVINFMLDNLVVPVFR